MGYQHNCNALGLLIYLINHTSITNAITPIPSQGTLESLDVRMLVRVVSYLVETMIEFLDLHIFRFVVGPSHFFRQKKLIHGGESCQNERPCHV
jgi:hypothetical protein